MGRLLAFSVHFQKTGGEGSIRQRCLCKVVKDCSCDSEALEELLELPDELCVHGLHQGPKALVPHQSLLRLQLLIDKLLERDAVHRVL